MRVINPQLDRTEDSVLHKLRAKENNWLWVVECFGIFVCLSLICRCVSYMQLAQEGRERESRARQGVQTLALKQNQQNWPY